MSFPEAFHAAVKAAVQEHPNNVPQAIKCAKDKIRASPAYQDHLDDYFHSAVASLVHDCRHHTNPEIRQAARQKVFQDGRTDSERKLLREQADLYGLFIAGTTLGKILGKHLPGIAADEDAKAEGHSFNARLCRLCAKVVPADKAVEEAIKPKKLQEFYAKAERGEG